MRRVYEAKQIYRTNGRWALNRGFLKSTAGLRVGAEPDFGTNLTAAALPAFFALERNLLFL
jgi:hypothetical protein